MARLGDVCKIVSGSTPSTTATDYWDGDIKWITPAELDENSFYITDSVRHITELGRTKTGLSYMPIGTVILSSRAPIGKTAIAGCEMCCNQGFKNLICSDKIHNEYLYFFLKGKTEFLNSLGRGATFKELSKSIVENIEIPLPSYEEQIKISVHMRKIEELLRLRKQQLSKLDELIKSRFIELFGDQETNPFGWEQCTVGECCTLKSGTTLSAEVENEGGSIPYVKVGDMNFPGNERYITTSSRYVSEETASKGLFEVGSIIFPKRGGAIGTNKKRMTKLPICADLNVMGVSSSGKLLPEYLFAYFDLVDLGALSDGSSVPQINNKNIAPLLICIPPIEIQNRFATFVEQVDKSKLAIHKSLEKLEILKKSLMQQYFG